MQRKESNVSPAEYFISMMHDRRRLEKTSGCDGTKVLCVESCHRKELHSSPGKVRTPDLVSEVNYSERTQSEPLA